MSFPFGSAEIQMHCTIHYSRNPWFYFALFWKLATDVQTYRQHLQKQWSLPVATVGRPSGSISHIFAISISFKTNNEIFGRVLSISKLLPAFSFPNSFGHARIHIGGQRMRYVENSEGCISCWQEKRNEKVWDMRSIMANLSLGQDVTGNRERK